jgi:hypothetical protein
MPGVGLFRAMGPSLCPFFVANPRAGTRLSTLVVSFNHRIAKLFFAA